MLYVTNEDKPGFIGALGMLLGNAGVNIATFNLGRKAQGGEAICLVQIDEPVAGRRAGRGVAPAAGEAGQAAGVLTLLQGAGGAPPILERSVPLIRSAPSGVLSIFQER